jgi:hypothetical protein
VPPEPLTFAFAVLVGALATARLSRLLVDDSYPPSVWARDMWRRITRDGSWSGLVDCHFCVTPYVAAVVLAWGWLSALHWSWWAFCGWLALAYTAAMIAVRDTPE